MAGVKGRSGRRSLSNEQKKFKVIDKAWDNLTQALQPDSKASYQEKLDISKLIVSRDISRNQSHNISVPLKYISNTPAPVIESKVIDIKTIDSNTIQDKDIEKSNETDK